jgi:hypothetical protein
MTVHPAGSGPAPRPEPSRPPRSAGAPPATDAVTAEPRQGDSDADGVELSSAARTLHARGDLDLPPISELSTGRLREILQRLVEGHYDRPEVQAQIAGRVLDALARGER